MKATDAVFRCTLIVVACLLSPAFASDRGAIIGYHNHRAALLTSRHIYRDDWHRHKDLILIYHSGKPSLPMQLHTGQVMLGDCCQMQGRGWGEIVRIGWDDMLTTSHKAAPGDSGSWLKDETGRLLGICHGANSQGNALFVGPWAIKEFMRQYPTITSKPSYDGE